MSGKLLRMSAEEMKTEIKNEEDESTKTPDKSKRWRRSTKKKQGM